MTPEVKPVPDPYNQLVPYIMLDDCANAIEWYKAVFGAEETMRFPAPGDKIGHAEVKIGNAVLMMADADPTVEAKTPRALGGSPVFLTLYMEDVDQVVQRARDNGAKVTREPEDQFYGDRSANFEDPFGHLWNVMTHIEDVSMEELGRRAAAMSEAPST